MYYCSSYYSNLLRFGNKFEFAATVHIHPLSLLLRNEQPCYINKYTTYQIMSNSSVTSHGCGDGRVLNGSRSKPK